MQAERQTECTTCLPGEYCDERGLSLGKICPTGHYCPGGTINPLPCPNVSTVNYLLFSCAVEELICFLLRCFVVAQRI